MRAFKRAQAQTQAPEPAPAPEQDPGEEALKGALAAEFGSDLNVQGLRSLFTGMTGMLNRRLPRIGGVTAGVAIGEDTPATVDVLRPAADAPHPVLVYLHGGAWIAGSPASHRKLTARFAEAGYLVFSVDYRLAPEHPFPAGLEDCLAAVRWVAQNAAEYGGDPARLAIGGDSAGANLAAAAAIELADSLTGPKISATLLIYGVFDMSDLGGPSVNELIHRAYLPGEPRQVLRDPRVSPIHAAHKLPPSFIVIGGQDALLPQSQALRDALAAAGRVHEYVEDRSMPHGFMQMEFLGGVRKIIRQMAGFLDVHLADTRSSRWRRWRMEATRKARRGLGSLARRGSPDA